MNKNRNVGKIVQILGPVVDVRFEKTKMPNLLNALELHYEKQKFVFQVMLHVGDNTVRTIAMGTTEGLIRGLEVVDTGNPIMVPVGKEILSRMFNVLGEPIDNQPAPKVKKYMPINRLAPAFEEQKSSSEILETGIKVIDLSLIHI